MLQGLGTAAHTGFRVVGEQKNKAHKKQNKIALLPPAAYNFLIKKNCMAITWHLHGPAWLM